MVCYVPRITTIAGVGAVLYVLLHRVIGRILHIAGLVLEITLITCLAVAAAALLAWTVRSVQRRRAAAGACSTCRFRCQQPMTLHPQPVTLRPQPVPLRARLPVAGARAGHQPGLPVAGARAGHQPTAQPRPVAGPRPEPWPRTPARSHPEPRPETGARLRPEPWPGTAAGARPETRPLLLG